MKKRALALVCAFAMGMTMCAGTNVSNTAKAAADGSTEAVENEDTDVSGTETAATPQVKIVGATISNQNGATQSLRFLMEVENYDQIKVSKGQDFGINLTVKGNTVPVTYKNYDKIYAVDETNNTLQYAVEINGINSDNITTDISAQGFVTGIPSETADNVATSEEVTRSVSGVATAAGYNITIDKNSKNMTLNKNFEAGYSVDLTKAQAIYGQGTIDRDSFSGAIKAKNVQGITVPIHDKGFAAGSDVEVTIYGTASGSSVRAWIAQNDSDKATAINDKVTMDSAFSLKINKSVASSLLYIKVAQAGETFDELNISKIDVKLVPVTIEKPAVAPEPYKLEFSDKTVKGSWGGNAVINQEEGTVTGTITGQYGNFEFDLPDDLVSKYYDTVTVKFKDANYQGKTDANIWMGLDTVNNGLLTDEPGYGNYFNHATAGEAVRTAASGPIKNVRIWTGDATPTKDKPYTFTIESVIFSNSKWINPKDVVDEYELELNKENVVAVNEKVDLTFNNNDNSVTIRTTDKDGEFGFKIPSNIYKANDFRKITISYRDSDLTEHLHYTQHYGTDVVGWNGKDNSQRSNISVMGEGTVTLNLSPATEDGNFSNMRFFDLVKGKKITITSVKLTK